MPTTLGGQCSDWSCDHDRLWVAAEGSWDHVEPCRGCNRGLAHAWSSGNVDKITSFFTEDCVFEDVCSGQSFRGQEALRAQARSVLAAAPDLRLDITFAFGEDGCIGAGWIETGTIDGRRFSLKGASIALMEGEKLGREWMYTHSDRATWFDA